MRFLQGFIFLLIAAVGASAQRTSDLGRLGGGSASPFGRNSDSSVRNRTVLFDLTKVGLLGRMETREGFDFIWGEFRRTHAIDVRGCFTPQENARTPDDAYTQNAFQQYVRNHAPSIFVLESEKCGRCDPQGKTPRTMGLDVVIIDCPHCAGQKNLKFLTEYRLLWPGKGAPKARFPDEMRAAIGFNGTPSFPGWSTIFSYETTRFVSKPSAGSAISDFSASVYNGRVDFVITLAARPDKAGQKVGYVVNFCSEADGQGQILATASGESSVSGSTRVSFAQFDYSGVVADSFKFTADYYFEALVRLIRAKSVVVTL